MRIAVVNWSARRVGGIEDYVSILLPALRGAGHDVAFFHEMDEPADRGRIDVPTGSPDWCAADIGTDQAIAALRDWAPDVVYMQGVRDRETEKRLLRLAPAVYFVHTYTGTCISGAKTFKTPSITPCHRTFGWPCLVHYFPRGCGGRSPMTMWRQYAQQSTQLSVLKTYDVVLTHSAHIRAEMTSHGIAADVVAYPVPPSSTSAVGDPARWRLLFAARMTRLKGGEYLLDALPDVAAALDRPVDVVLAGDGPERSRLERRAGEIAARCPQVSIEFVGWTTQEHLASLLGATDLLVVPSLWPEPFGAVGPFAAGHGIPAAAFDVGGITEWLVDGVGGHLAPGNPPRPEGLSAAIVRCLADPVHHAELKRGALEGSVRFTMDRHLAGLMPALRRAVNAHRG